MENICARLKNQYSTEENRRNEMILERYDKYFRVKGKFANGQSKEVCASLGAYDIEVRTLEESWKLAELVKQTYVQVFPVSYL